MNILKEWPTLFPRETSMPGLSRGVVCLLEAE